MVIRNIPLPSTVLIAGRTVLATLLVALASPAIVHAQVAPGGKAESSVAAKAATQPAPASAPQAEAPAAGADEIREDQDDAPDEQPPAVAVAGQTSMPETAESISLARNDVIGVVVGLVVLLALLAIFLRWRGAEPVAQAAPTSRQRVPGGSRSAGIDQEVFVHRLDAAMAEVSDRLLDLERKTAALDQRLMKHEAGRPTARSYGTNPYPPEAVLDRRNGPVKLPEDSFQRAPVAPPPPIPPAPEPQGQLPRTQSELVEAYNRAVKPAEFSALAEAIGAEFYTNERGSDISVIFKSDVDRFWLSTFQDNPNEAILLPGFSVRRSWHTYRNNTPDHPLAHHFDLVQGDEFVLNRPARLIRDTDGNWQLKSKGEVGGVI